MCVARLNISDSHGTANEIRQNATTTCWKVLNAVIASENELNIYLIVPIPYRIDSISDDKLSLAILCVELHNNFRILVEQDGCQN